MPYIQVTHTEGALEGVDRAALTDALAAAGSEAEGTDIEKARPLSWVTYDAPDDFHCNADPAVAVRASVAEGLIGDDDKDTLVSGITDALTDAVADLDAEATWVLVDEVPDGNWGAGGSVVSTAEVAALTGGEVVE
jgi:4-oxalocrotonate tautomerase family enzyme